VYEPASSAPAPVRREQIQVVCRIAREVTDDETGQRVKQRVPVAWRDQPRAEHDLE
jgi:hypothetical protein